MARKRTIFDEGWLTRARLRRADVSWADEVMATVETNGGIYLESLRLWFNRFRLTSKQKQALATRLESLDKKDHLGAVNELAWWAFMQHEGMNAAPVPTSATPRPDFQIIAPAECFVEVSTLNVSDRDKSKFAAGGSVELNHSQTLRRILSKVTNEKRRQLSYAAGRKQPSVLVLFDYTTWSKFGTQFFRFLGNFLLGKQLGFHTVPSELSALVYVERKVHPDGRIAISRDRSAAYYNPSAKYPLPVGTFASVNEFWCQMVTTEPKSADHWVWL
jgi:hypothetical protein